MYTQSNTIYWNLLGKVLLCEDQLYLGRYFCMYIAYELELLLWWFHAYLNAHLKLIGISLLTIYKSVVVSNTYWVFLLCIHLISKSIKILLGTYNISRIAERFLKLKSNFFCPLKKCNISINKILFVHSIPRWSISEESQNTIFLYLKSGERFRNTFRIDFILIPKFCLLAPIFSHQVLELI